MMNNDSCGTSCSTAKSAADIKERMEVVGFCGNKLGVVDHVGTDTIQLTRNDSEDGLHHFVPMSWVENVDDKVQLNRDCGKAKAEWASEGAMV
jgi:hypothetical protein